MAHLITINPDSSNNKLFYDSDKKTFYGNEKDIPFSTTYEVKNPGTGISKTFEFSHSTGPEFDPKTDWIYKGPDGLQLIISNDPDITKERAESYLKAKLRN